MTKTVRQKMVELLGTRSRRPSADDRGRYHSNFASSGQEKAAEILRDLTGRFGADLSTFAYASIGGSTGAEIIHVLEHSSIRMGLLLEHDTAAVEIARQDASRLQALGKTLRVVCGDATQRIEECRTELLSWRSVGISGLVASAQAVLHELPRRSPGFKLESFLGELFWKWNPCVFYSREPCIPVGWPPEVSMSIADIPSELLETLALDVQGRLGIPGDIRRAGPQLLSLPSILAVELLMKVFYLDDYHYEIEEQLTSLDPTAFVRIIELFLGENSVSHRYLNSNSFEGHYRSHGVSAFANGHRLPMPLAFLAVVAVRNSSIPLVAGRDDSLAFEESSRRRPVSVAAALGHQRATVLNTPLIPWLPRSSPSLGFLWPELVVEPTVRPRKHPGAPSRIHLWLDTFRWNGNVAIVGAPGAGKSTALRRLFLRLADRAECADSPLPVIGHAADYIAPPDSHSHGAAITAAAIAAARESDRPVVFLIDGLDELGSDAVERLLVEFVLTLRPNESCWVACRSEQFGRFLVSTRNWAQLFSEHLELCAWSESADSMPFVERYAARVGDPRLVSRFDELRTSRPGLRQFLTNPFLLTLIIYLSQDGAELRGDSFANPYAVYRDFYHHWLKRERQRGTSALGRDAIRRLHRLIAADVFRSRAIGRPVSLSETEGLVPALSDSAFTDILEIDDDEQIVGYRHETLGEYLLAEQVLEALRSAPPDSTAALEVTYNYDVNNFVRDALSLATAMERAALVQSITHSYRVLTDAASELEPMEEDPPHQSGAAPRAVDKSGRSSLVVREQLLYYLGRVPDVPYPEILTQAFRDETHPLLRRSAALSAVLQGQVEIESAYLATLTPGSVADVENRSVQLVYFGDVRGDIWSFVDDGTWRWPRTRRAIAARLQEAGIRNMRLRWWDLRTFYLFCASRSRSVAEVSDEDLAIVRDTCVLDASSFRQAALEAEKERLLTLLVGRGSSL